MKYVLAISVASAIFACNSEPALRSIRAWYYPLVSLSSGKVYAYESVGHPYDPPIYWYYRTLQRGDKRYLAGTSFDLELLPDQFILEKELSDGMRLDSFVTYEPAGDGRKIAIAAEVVTGNIFPFKTGPGDGILLTKVHWQSPANSAKLTFVRNRQYLADSTVVFDGDTLPAVRFVVRELIDSETEGHLELEYAGEEVYAKGIGLVYFEKDINPEWQMKYALRRIYPGAYFEHTFGVKLTGQ